MDFRKVIQVFFVRLIWNGQLNINQNFKWNFIQLNLLEEMINDGEVYLNHVVLNVYLFLFVENYFIKEETNFFNLGYFKNYRFSNLYRYRCFIFKQCSKSLAIFS